MTKTNKPRILICNDDGIHANGIRHLWNSLKDYAHLTVIAPANEQSAVSLSITVRQPLEINQITWENGAHTWCVNGTPADCIKIGLNAILDSPPDLIVSGINRGSNAGRNILYSGTVAAAIEGVMHDIPSIAFSCHDYHKMPDYAKTEQYIQPIVHDILNNPLPRGTLLNVNFPSRGLEIKGFKLTKNGMQYWAENPDRREHPANGESHYWLGARMAAFTEDEDCDVRWMEKGFIAAVPINVNQLTDLRHLEERRSKFDQLFCKI